MKKKLSLLLFIFIIWPLLSVELKYGIHYPNGKAAVDYMTGAEGTWHEMNNIKYTYNYYSQWAHANHAFDKEQLITEAQTYGHNRTCRDANGHLLLDFNHDLEIDVTGGYAFHEHNGRNGGGNALTGPFYQYWFDDNWLAREMCQAYQKPHPYGLHDAGSFIRWSPVNGNTTRFTPYHSNHVDTLVLDGLYYLGGNKISQALSKWDKCRDLASPYWKDDLQCYEYDIKENYHLGMFAMLSGQLMDHASVSSSKKSQILQHYVSIRHHILQRQEKRGAKLLSWTSGLDWDNLMNTETVACSALGLAPDSIAVFEAGVAPLYYNSNQYFYRPERNVISAVKGISQPGHLVYGPYYSFPRGQRKAQIILKAHQPAGEVALLDIYSNGILASRKVTANDLQSDTWKIITLDFNNDDPNRVIEVRVWWSGNCDLDVAFIKIK